MDPKHLADSALVQWRGADGRWGRKPRGGTGRLITNLSPVSATVLTRAPEIPTVGADAEGDLLGCFCRCLVLLVGCSLTLACGGDEAPGGDLPMADVVADGGGADVVLSCEGRPNGTPCTDGDPCSLEDKCQGEICVASINKTCDSENPCVVGSCEATTGNCLFVELADGAACSVACFGASTCTGGQCAVDPATEVDCSAALPAAQAANPCLDDLKCSQTDGDCTEEIYRPGGASCDTDSDLCSLEACTAGGECVDLGESVSCANESAANPCGLYACDPGSGECASSGFAGPIPCDDKNACTTDDTCFEDDFGFHLCKGDPIEVDDGNPCTDDQCKTGVVSHSPIPGLPCGAKTDCSDTWLCTVEGQCEPGPPNASCDNGLACTTGICDLATGDCVQVVADGACFLEGACFWDGEKDDANVCLICDPDSDDSGWSYTAPGSSCEDASACTQDDTCDGAGTCVGGASKECPNPACASPSCDPATGDCVYDVDPGQCFIDGICLSDAASSPQTLCLFCDQTASQITWSPVAAADNLPCGDADICNGIDLCDGTGACATGAAISCDDANPCTLDSCHPATGACSHTIKAGCPILVASPTGENLHGIWGDGTGTIWVVGDNGTILMAEDETWTLVPPPGCIDGFDLLSITGTTGNNIWFGASDERLMHFDGFGFSCASDQGAVYQVDPNPNDYPIYKLWGKAPNTFLAFRYIKFAAGYLLHIYEWKGANWANIGMQAGFGAAGIPARPVTSCATNNVILSTFPNPNLGQTDAKIQRFNGTNSLTVLNPFPNPADPVREMRDGLCPASDDLTMVGHFGQVTHWDGLSLDRINLYSGYAPDDRPTLWALDGAQDEMVAVGDWGSIARSQLGVWEELTPVTDVRLNDVWISPDGNTWIVGDQGTIIRIDPNK